MRTSLNPGQRVLAMRLFCGRAAAAFVLFQCISNYSIGQTKIPSSALLTEIISGKHIVKKATSSIKAYNQVNAQSATFVAGKVIVLEPGFHVGGDAKFLGKIANSENTDEVTILENENTSDELSDSELNIITFPNPFIESTQIEYYLPQGSVVSLSVVNIRGSEVARLVDKEKQAKGKYKISFGNKGFLPGVYTCVLSTTTGQKVYKVLKL